MIRICFNFKGVDFQHPFKLYETFNRISYLPCILEAT